MKSKWKKGEIGTQIGERRQSEERVTERRKQVAVRESVNQQELGERGFRRKPSVSSQEIVNNSVVQNHKYGTDYESEEEYYDEYEYGDTVYYYEDYPGDVETDYDMGYSSDYSSEGAGQEWGDRLWEEVERDWGHQRDSKQQQVRN